MNPTSVTTVAEIVAKQRDTSRDNALVLRATSAGTPGSRTQAFLDYCVGCPLREVTPETIVSYAATRAFVEGTWTPAIRPVVGEPGKPSRRDQRLPTAFRDKPHWIAMASALESLAASLIEPEAAIAAAKAPVSSALIFDKPGFGHAESAGFRGALLKAAAVRMGLVEPPMIALVDLHRHAYYADRSAFDRNDEDGDQPAEVPLRTSAPAAPEGLPRQASSESLASSAARTNPDKAALGVSVLSGLSAVSPQSQRKALKRSGLHQLNQRAEREKRLTGTEAGGADAGPDIKGAATFEWTRSHAHKRNGYPVITEELWTSVKGVVFLVEPSAVADAGRSLYYRMVFAPLFTGRDITEELGRMVWNHEDTAAVQAAAAAEEDPFAESCEDFDEFAAGPWVDIDAAEDNAGVAEMACSLCCQRLAYPDRHRVRGTQLAAERRHVDLVFDLLRRDFRIIGVLDDQARELWL
jgi:hypothetical protein